MADTPVRVFLSPEMAAQMPQVEGVEIVVVEDEAAEARAAEQPAEQPAQPSEPRRTLRMGDAAKMGGVADSTRDALREGLRAVADAGLAAEAAPPTLAGPPMLAGPPPEPRPFVGYYGNFYYHYPSQSPPFHVWYFDDGRMDEPCYLPNYRLARHPEDPDAPWLTFIFKSPATLRVVLEAYPDYGDRALPRLDDRFNGSHVDLYVNANKGGVLKEYYKRPPRPLPHQIKNVALRFPDLTNYLDASSFEMAGDKVVATFDISGPGLKDKVLQHMSNKGSFQVGMGLAWKATTWARKPDNSSFPRDHERFHAFFEPNFREKFRYTRCQLLELWTRRIANPAKYGKWTAPGQFNYERKDPYARDPYVGFPQQRDGTPSEEALAKFEVEFYTNKLSDLPFPFNSQPAPHLREGYDKPRTDSVFITFDSPLNPLLHPKLYPDYAGGSSGSSERYAAAAVQLKAGTQFVYYLPSDPKNFYYLPEAFNLEVNNDGSPKGFVLDLVSGGGSGDSEPVVSVELTAKPAPPVELITEASRVLPQKYAVSRIDLHILNPTSMQATLQMPSKTPGERSDLKTLQPGQADLRRGVTAGFDCTLAVFQRNVFERLFERGALVLTGSVAVNIKRETEETVPVPISFRFPEPPADVSRDKWRDSVWKQIRPKSTSAVFTRLITFEAQERWFKSTKKIVVEVTGSPHSLVFTAEGPFTQALKVSTSMPEGVPDPSKWFDFDYRAVWVYEDRDSVTTRGHATGDYVVLERPA